MMSAGVSIHSRIGRHSATVTTAKRTEKTAASHTMFPT